MSSVRFIRISPNLKSNLNSSLRRLEFNYNPIIGLNRFKRFKWEEKNDIVQYSFLLFIAAFSFFIMVQPIWFKLFLISTYTLSLLVPFTCQFFLPALPIFSWLLFFYSSQFIPQSYRPHIWVSVLPTLESVLYGANISDILTRYTNSLLDVMAWLPYGVVHFAAPFLVAISLFVFAPPKAIRFWATAFGYMNLFGVMIQIVFPCAPPWYELRNGLVPANYNMRGSPGGLARIDALFHGTGYTNTFTAAPVPFGAFPSLHAGCSTMEALFLSHFFPKGRAFYWIYVFWLYWSTMYLTHHYLIDLVAGGSLAVICFYFFLPEDMRHLNFSPTSSNSSSPSISPTNRTMSIGLNTIPLDPESGTSAVNGGVGIFGNGINSNGLGGKEEDRKEVVKNSVPPNGIPGEKGKSANE